MRVLVCGSREWPNDGTIQDDLYNLAVRTRMGDFIVIEGGAQGADRIAKNWAEAHDPMVVVETYPADWNTHGKAAGFIRNQQMIDSRPDLVLAYWDGESRGTKHTIDLALRAKINLRVTFP